MRTVFVVGASGHGNVGDDYLSTSIASNLSISGYRVVVATDEGSVWPSTVPQSRPRFLRHVRRGDLVLIGGGTLLSDRWGTAYIKYYSSIAVAVRALGAIPLGVGLGASAPSTVAGRLAFASWRLVVSRTLVRDEPSLAVVRDRGVRNARLAPDMGWAGPAAENSSQVIASAPVTLAISLVGETFEAGERRVMTLASAINGLAERGALDRVCGISMLNRTETALNDGYWLGRLRQLISVPFALEKVSTWRDAVAIMEGAHAVLSYRLHGGILAYQRARPIVVVARESKLVEAFKSLPHASVLPEDHGDSPGGLERMLESALSTAIVDSGSYFQTMRATSDGLRRQCLLALNSLVDEV